MEKQINYMWEEYELTYNHALEIRDESLTDPAEMRRRIPGIKDGDPETRIGERQCDRRF